MLRRIIDWFKRKRDGVDPSRVWSVSAHQTWGDNIDIQVMPEARGGQLLQVSGHLSNPKMREGDFLAVPMLSRRTALYRVHDLSYTGDPRDLFFAKASFVRYAEEHEHFSEPGHRAGYLS